MEKVFLEKQLTYYRKLFVTVKDSYFGTITQEQENTIFAELNNISSMIQYLSHHPAMYQGDEPPDMSNLYPHLPPGSTHLPRRTDTEPEDKNK